MQSSPLNYITIIANIHMEQKVHTHVYVPVTVTHIKDKGGKQQALICIMCNTLLARLLFPTQPTDYVFRELYTSVEKLCPIFRPRGSLFCLTYIGQCEVVIYFNDVRLYSNSKLNRITHKCMHIIYVFIKMKKNKRKLK